MKTRRIWGPLMALMMALTLTMVVMPTTTAAPDKTPQKGVQLKIEWGNMPNGNSTATMSSNPTQVVEVATLGRFGGPYSQMTLTPAPLVREWGGPSSWYNVDTVFFRHVGQALPFLAINWYSGQCLPGPTVLYEDGKGSIENMTNATHYASHDGGNKWRTVQPGQVVKFKVGDEVILSPTQSEYNLCLRVASR